MKKYIIILVVFIGAVILLSCQKNMEGLENSQNSICSSITDETICKQQIDNKTFKTVCEFKNGNCQQKSDYVDPTQLTIPECHKNKKTFVTTDNNGQSTCHSIYESIDAGKKCNSNNGIPDGYCKNIPNINGTKGCMDKQSCDNLDGTFTSQSTHINPNNPPNNPKHQDDPWATDDGSTESIFDDPTVTDIEVNDGGKWVEKKTKHHTQPKHHNSDGGNPMFPSGGNPVDYCKSGTYSFGSDASNCKKIPTVPDGCSSSTTEFCAIVNNESANTDPNDTLVNMITQVPISELKVDRLTNYKCDTSKRTMLQCVQDWFKNTPAANQKNGVDPVKLNNGKMISSYGSN